MQRLFPLDETRNAYQPIHRAPVKRVYSPEGTVPKEMPFVPKDSPGMGWLRAWHLRPWRPTSFLDVALADDVTDSGSGTDWTDVVNNLVTQAGTVLTARSLPSGMTPFVPRPVPGQVVPRPTPSTTFGMSTTQLLLVGAAVLGGFMLIKGRKG